MEKKMNIQEVEKVIKRLSVLKEFKAYCEEDPFLPSPGELLQLQEDISEMLHSYMDFLREWDAGNLVLGQDDAHKIKNPESQRMGKNAPAYKDSIDEKLIYSLWKDGVPINEIARRVKCSPHTVKRRILNLLHGLEDR